jgi:hypothetical protein
MGTEARALWKSPVSYSQVLIISVLFNVFFFNFPVLYTNWRLHPRKEFEKQ